DSTVTLESRHERYSLGVLEQNVNVYLNRFTGPGRLGIQSM
ncbi:MAG: AIM24 family protein, partial [Chloroflexi bacterium]|nr:AIM24 family protein [Chloroflexota bacterium]